MSAAKKRSGFQITSVTSDLLHLTNLSGRLSHSVVRTVQSEAFFTRPHGSSSQPTSPSLKRKQITHDAQGPRAGCSSRFRVVRLARGGASSCGRDELYRRGRWTCVEFMERQVGVGCRRVMDSMRHAHSLESLEIIDQDTERGGVHSQDTAHLFSQPVTGDMQQEPISLQLQDQSGQEAGLVLQSWPPSPMQHKPISTQNLDKGEREVGPILKDTPPTPVHLEPITAQNLSSTPTATSPRPQSFPRPLRQLNVDATRRSVLRTSQSLPSSPPSHSPSLTSPQSPAVFGLDRSIFSLPGDASASSSSLPAIDNKIEQAMDLVKSHLMLAVREEVELLREQIREQQEKNQQLERENHILRALTHSYTATQQY
uniref:TSC22 domain family, member 2 n=1 Tax=Nothobranchius rachovii TaxID=451742 RepID=A0A1A8PCS4_9TELE